MFATYEILMLTQNNSTDHTNVQNVLYLQTYMHTVHFIHFFFFKRLELIIGRQPRNSVTDNAFTNSYVSLKSRLAHPILCSKPKHTKSYE